MFYVLLARKMLCKYIINFGIRSSSLMFRNKLILILVIGIERCICHTGNSSQIGAYTCLYEQWDKKQTGKVNLSEELGETARSCSPAVFLQFRGPLMFFQRKDILIATYYFFFPSPLQRKLLLCQGIQVVFSEGVFHFFATMILQLPINQYYFSWC